MNALAKARKFPEFNDVLFTCYGKLGELMPSSKLASTFVNSIEFLELCYTTVPKDFGEAKQHCQNMLAFHR